MGGIRSPSGDRLRHAAGTTVALWTGLGLGFLVAAQVGPIWLLCARSVLRGRLVTGLAIGAGAAPRSRAKSSVGPAAPSMLPVTG